jgi:hypothetical protein
MCPWLEAGVLSKAPNFVAGPNAGSGFCGNGERHDVTLKRTSPSKAPTIKRAMRLFMALILLEALLALLLLLLIVWWTMFSGRKNGELKVKDLNEDDPEQGDKSR